jgi:hypothetical protein
MVVIVIKKKIGNKERWDNLPKGPEVTDAELKTIKDRIMSGLVIKPDICRRLIQTFEAKLNRTKKGFLEPLPPIGSRVYDYNGFGDECDWEVVAHVGTSEIRVKSGKEEAVIGSWHENRQGNKGLF